MTALAMLSMLGACKDASPTPCANDSDCASAERCNTMLDECQEIFSAQQGEPCSVDEHCDDDLLCPYGVCETNLYGPCDSEMATGCGGESFCTRWMPDPIVGGACTTQCGADDECAADEFVGRAAPACLIVLADEQGTCGVPCSVDADCGSAATSDGRTAEPRCSSLGACIWALES